MKSKQNKKTVKYIKMKHKKRGKDFQRQGAEPLKGLIRVRVHEWNRNMSFIDFSQTVNVKLTVRESKPAQQIWTIPRFAIRITF